MLSKLPPELLAIVLTHVTRTDLKRLCEVSKGICILVTPYLYKSIIIPATQSAARNIIYAITKLNQAQLVHTRDLGLCGPFHGMRPGKTCSFHHPLHRGNEHPGSESSVFEPISELVDNLHLAVSMIPQDQLRSFKWDLGTCLPDELAHRINLILKVQNQITSLSLITDSDCKVNKDASCSLNLVQLSKLRSLSWKGLKRYGDFESVRGLIAAHGAQLKTLDLDLIGWDSARLAWTHGFRQKSTPNARLPENFFAQCVLGVQHGELRTSLPALQHLALSQVSFSPMEIE